MLGYRFHRIVYAVGLSCRFCRLALCNSTVDFFPLDSNVECTPGLMGNSLPVGPIPFGRGGGG